MKFCRLVCKGIFQKISGKKKNFKKTDAKPKDRGFRNYILVIFIFSLCTLPFTKPKILNVVESGPAIFHICWRRLPITETSALLTPFEL